MRTRNQLLETSSSSSDDTTEEVEKHTFLAVVKNQSFVDPNETIRIEGHPDFYHPSYDTNGIADLPEFLGAAPHDKDYMEKEDQELLIFPAIDSDRLQTHEELKQQLFQWSPLPLETTLQLWAHCSFDVFDTLTLAAKLVEPQILPSYVKSFFQANITGERFYQLNKKHEDIRRFHFAPMFETVVDSKTLVDLYYKEKNKQKPDWRFEADKEWSEEEMLALEKRMAKSKIRIITVDQASCKRKRFGCKKRSPLTVKRIKSEEPWS
ncbi:hypothetical protein B9Z55_026306 [Caenorhabditis nigoni]|uniref:Uncharacterized protein n=1 Tax=Caenorhabditis nigoni TaxID=1611254 RepID=A0A2G5T271_9PELO|nr:hypothetical protein B9Z55_026306 [Caenorhabditis nigoni]